MSISVLILIARRYGFAPRCTAFEINVVHVSASVDNIDINALAAIVGVQVLIEVAEGKRFSVGDTSKTPWGILLDFWVGRVRFQSMNLLVPLNNRNLSVV